MSNIIRRAGTDDEELIEYWPELDTTMSETEFAIT
jgi:hypothetical protein